MATNVQITHIEDIDANIVTGKRASMWAYSSDENTYTGYLSDNTTRRRIYTLDVNYNSLYPLGNVTITSTKYFGLDAAKGRFTFTDAATDTIEVDDATFIINEEELKQVHTGAGATAGPIHRLYRDSASPASNNELGATYYDGENDAAEQTTYARTYAEIESPADGAEYGRWYLALMVNGALTDVLSITTDLTTMTFTGNIVLDDDKWIGLGGSDVRLVFDSTASQAQFKSTLILSTDGNIMIEKGLARTIYVESQSSTGAGNDLTVQAGGGYDESAGGDLYLKAGEGADSAVDGDIYITNADDITMDAYTDIIIKIAATQYGGWSADGLKVSNQATIHAVAQDGAPTSTTAGALWVDTNASTNGDLMVYANGAWRKVISLP